MKRPGDRDRWTLREGDLPSERMLELAPELRGLEDNAFFRAILWRRRGRAVEIPLGYVRPAAALACIAIYLHFDPQADPSWPIVFVVLCAVLLWRCILPSYLLRKRSRDPRSGALFGVSHQMIQDLCHSGFPAMEIALACWGSDVTRNQLRRRDAIRIFALGSMVALAAILQPTELARSFMLTGIVYVNMALPLRRLDPFESLQSAIVDLNFSLGGEVPEPGSHRRSTSLSGTVEGAIGRRRHRWVVPILVMQAFSIMAIYSPNSPLDGGGLILWLEIAAAALVGYLAGRIIAVPATADATWRANALRFLLAEVSIVLNRATRGSTENPFPEIPGA